MNTLKTRLIILAFAILSISSYGQIKVSEIVQANSLSQSENNKLYFVDFWATWCGPCVPAKKYLGSLQKQYPNDFYVVSISNENPVTIKKFLEKRKTNLSIAIDFDSETFNTHKITSLPQGILFNARGKKLWQGHSADLTPSMIDRFLKTNTEKTTVDSFVKLEAYKRAIETTNEVVSDSDLELVPIPDAFEVLRINNSGEFSVYKGRLQSILAFLLGVSDQQVKLPPALLKSSYSMTINNKSRKSNNLVKHVLRALKLKMEESSAHGELVTFLIESPRFWDTDQINWGKNNPKYLIGDDQIQGDNVSFNDIIYRLSNLLQLPLMTEGVASTDEHDWQIHYKYFELMQSDLLDNYGIRAEKKTGEYPIFTIRKKAP